MKSKYVGTQLGKQSSMSNRNHSNLVLGDIQEASPVMWRLRERIGIQKETAERSREPREVLALDQESLRIMWRSGNICLQIGTYLRCNATQCREP